MKHWLLIGHRGVGKSSLLGHLKNNKTVSLDQYIEQQVGKTIAEIFKEGESHFRKLEEELLAKLVSASDQPLIIDVGAGYQGEKPKNCKALWLKRKINSKNSKFLNRPLLDNSLELSESRFVEREKNYSRLADLTIELRQGEDLFSQAETLLFAALFNNKNTKALGHWIWTLQNDSEETVDLLQNLGIGHYEYRDDLLAEKPEIDPLLVSLRESKTEPVGDFWDWPLEWGENPRAPLLSCHDKNLDLPETDQSMKLAISVDNFSELKKYHNWRMQYPEKRNFLPISKLGRWSWYRLLHSQKSAINFLRLAQGSAKDQPSLLQVLSFNPQFTEFAAILGSPVEHSFTPSFHESYFVEKKANVLAIDIREEEFDGAMSWLAELGLRYAAVTSPLKEKAGSLIQSNAPVNTLFYDGETWSGVNTDNFGLLALKEKAQSQRVAVWGGGGVVKSIQEVFPTASFYSSRTGELKFGDGGAPEVLIWAVGFSHFNNKGVLPPQEWPIRQVLDLNYTQDSPGIACAHGYGCQYESGLGMFKGQALKQQEFWNECRLK